MTEIATELLAIFDTLPAEDQHELVAHILRRTGDFPGTATTDDGLTVVVDQLFQSLDAEEAGLASFEKISLLVRG